MMATDENSIYTDLRHYQLPELNKQILRPDDIQVHLADLSARKKLRSGVIGHSFLNQDITQYSIGHGPLTICAWSQMHGDEATATAALLDFLNLLTSEQSLLKDDWANKITLHILPMVNPDGAAQGTRENAQGIDINRDALNLQTPEGRLLNKFIDVNKADYAFNLHDQCDYYGHKAVDAVTTKEANHANELISPVSIAFLAPPYNAENSVDHSRYNAMQLIAALTQSLNPLVSGNIAKYDDEYSERCFGEQTAAKGISTILIESGYCANDPNRQLARLANLYALVFSCNYLCETLPKAKQSAPEGYTAIPHNIENAWVDLALRKLTLYSYLKQSYRVDLGIRKLSRFDDSRVVYDIGDLRNYGAERDFDASEYEFQAGQSLLVEDEIHLDKASYIALLKKGQNHFVGNSSLINNVSGLPIVCNPKEWHEDERLLRNVQANGLLLKDKRITHALINGTLIDLEDEELFKHPGN
ncbi:peptidase M14 [Glaciecola sp. MH2013]|uniref:M14 family zinc carboxypeptidase n=1 Tax=Glaciecola sp. MH2013 TaxID=2785524 RepID=UPI00189CDB89|nr:M14 family zinc carboxypeptidase [Glaciecola sp. MH2013]MBF7074010.1 peptidase M14 [Glaciecola sp. MH2013]